MQYGASVGDVSRALVIPGLVRPRINVRCHREAPHPRSRSLNGALARELHVGKGRLAAMIVVRPVG